MKTLNRFLLYNTILLFFIIVFCPTTALSQSWKCGELLLDQRDGQSYSTVKIGEQCWMSQNINYGKFIVSDSSGALMKNDKIVEKYCWENNPDSCYKSKIHAGGFYEFAEAIQYSEKNNNESIQGICPDGWHIPSQKEFSKLITFVGDTVVGGKELKIGGSSGFNGEISGWRCAGNGSFLTVFPKGFWWSSTSYNDDEAWFFDLSSTNSEASLKPYDKTLGFNVRCIKK